MLDENRLWRAVSERDASWDGVFVYAVTSTGVYCRPTCASRRPRRDRVRFFARGKEAAAAGFRPCRRCRPGEPIDSAPSVARVRDACAEIARANGTPISLRQLAKRVGVGEHHLLRTFKRVLGISPREYADACRSGILKAALRTSRSVADAGYAAGYGSGSRVYERAPSMLGMTPARYAAGAGGETVRYATASTSIGHVLVATTPRGICAVKLGDDPSALERGIRAEFPEADVQQTDTELSSRLKTIVESIEGHAPDPRLPLDVRATAFQRRVWRELQRIPRGSTRSYQEVARRIGQPGAARAVARACASNPTAILVPCHRAVRADGSPGGYRWGAERKTAILATEKR